MKKIVVIFIIALMLCSSIVAAGVWDKLTGNAASSGGFFSNLFAKKATAANAMPKASNEITKKDTLSPDDLLTMLDGCSYKGMYLCCPLPETNVVKAVESKAGIQALKTNIKASTVNARLVSPFKNTASVGAARNIPTTQQRLNVQDVPEDPNLGINPNGPVAGMAVASSQATIPSEMQVATPKERLTYQQLNAMLAKCKIYADEMCCPVVATEPETKVELDLKLQKKAIKIVPITTTAVEGDSNTCDPMVDQFQPLTSAVTLPKVYSGGIIPLKKIQVEVADITVSQIKVKITPMRETGNTWNGAAKEYTLNKQEGYNLRIPCLINITVAGFGNDYVDLVVKYENTPPATDGTQDVYNAVYQLDSRNEMYNKIFIKDTEFKILDMWQGDILSNGRCETVNNWRWHFESASINEDTWTLYKGSEPYASKMAATYLGSIHDGSKNSPGPAAIYIGPVYPVRYYKASTKNMILLTGAQVSYNGDAFDTDDYRLGIFKNGWFDWSEPISPMDPDENDQIEFEGYYFKSDHRDCDADRFWDHPHGYRQVVSNWYRMQITPVA